MKGTQRATCSRAAELILGAFMSLPSAGLEVQCTLACKMLKPSTAETKLCTNNAAFPKDFSPWDFSIRS